MTFLVFAACLAIDPDECRIRSIPLPDRAASLACVMTAQFTLSQWTRDHPEWRIKEWRCDDALR